MDINLLVVFQPIFMLNETVFENIIKYIHRLCEYLFLFLLLFKKYKQIIINEQTNQIPYK